MGPPAAYQAVQPAGTMGGKGGIAGATERTTLALSFAPLFKVFVSNTRCLLWTLLVTLADQWL